MEFCHPCLLSLVIRKPFHNKLIYSVQSHFPVRRIFDRHCDERNIRIRRFLRLVAPLHFLDHSDSVGAVDVQRLVIQARGVGIAGHPGPHHAVRRVQSAKRAATRRCRKLLRAYKIVGRCHGCRR